MDHDPVVVFDLDDTLIPNEVYYRAAKQRWADYVRETLDPPYDRDAVLDRLDTTDQIYHDELLGRADERFWTSGYTAYMYIARETGQDPDPKKITRAGTITDAAVTLSPAHYRAAGFVETAPGDAPVRGADQVLDVLQERGADLHLVTAGAHRVQAAKIDGLELEQWFGDDITILRGDKSPALETITDRYAHDAIWMVGNSVSSDVEPALDAGLGAVHFPYDRPAVEEDAQPDGRFVAIDRIEDLVDVYDTVIAAEDV